MANSRAQFSPRSDHDLTHKHRVRRMHITVSSLLIVLGSFWAVFFGTQGNWLVVLLDLVLIGLGAAGIVLTRHGHVRAASLLLIVCVYLVICGISIFLDIPTALAPRSTHQFLLALSIAVYLLLRDEHAWVRHGIALICGTTFLVFASVPSGIVTEYATPDNVRIFGTWVNNLGALIALYLILHIIQTDIEVRSAIESDLWRGLPGNQFQLHYQPQVAAENRIVGAEALVRWQHPHRGMISPSEFIPMAEETGMILPLGQWVLETACAQLVAWSRVAETAELTLAVNVSVQQFRQLEFVTQVIAVIEQTGIDPTKLKLELTESLFVHDINDIITKMTLLKARGVQFSLDDFGTGYSSLSYLQRLPLDQLKIDQAFVQEVLTDQHGAAIARTVVALGQSLGLTVIAEGVETVGQLEFLKAHGCHAFQGYLCSKPLPVAEFNRFVTQRAQELP